ncbi:MAG: hypothetical protein N2512_09110 [Armatimonadetes bacterium]|nr:hypothetical protein [Armatimonadota bacterium]
MGDLCALAKVARQVLERVVSRVCGACERNCCHQGTMMGIQDLRRVVRGLRVDAELAERLRTGLKEKAFELEADVAAARQVLSLVKSSGLGDERAHCLAEARIADLEDLAKMLAAETPLDYPHLQRLLLHTALRHNLLRAFRSFPMGEGALARFGGPASSFKFRGSRLAPPRCIFHSLTLGCMAGKWKPAKCANFFCTADPSLLDAIREHMDFDDFVLANFEPATMDWILANLKAQAELGPSYHEPMVIVGMGKAQAEELRDRLEAAAVETRMSPHPSVPFPPRVVEKVAAGVPAGTAELIRFRKLSGTDIYDLAIGLDRVRLRDAQRMLVFIAETLEVPSSPPHALWLENTIAQPVGYLECYVLASGATQENRGQ